MHRLQQTNLHQAGLHRTQVYHILSKIGASCTTSYCSTAHSRTHNDYNKQRFFIVHQKPGEHNIRTTSHTIMRDKQRLQQIHVYHIISKKTVAYIKKPVRLNSTAEKAPTTTNKPAPRKLAPNTNVSYFIKNLGIMHDIVLHHNTQQHAQRPQQTTSFHRL